MPTISCCMIVKNEEKFLEQCLNSIKELVDEIIIVDTGSADKTKEIAAQFTDKIFDFQWCDDFSTARNESLKHASGDWILVLDADETISSQDHEHIKKLIATDMFLGYFLILRNYSNELNLTNYFSSKDDIYLESKICSGWKETSALRLFKNDPKLQYGGVIHESISLSNIEERKVLNSSVPIHHFGNVLKPITAEKHDFYEQLTLKKVDQDPNFFSYFELGNVYVRKENLDKALVFFQKSVEFNGAFFESLLMLGNVYLMKQEFNLAKNCYLRALKLNSKNANLYSNLALILMNEKDYNGAIDSFIQSIILNPKNAAAHYQLGKCFHLMGDNNRAYLALKNALELNPKYKDEVEFEWE